MALLFAPQRSASVLLSHRGEVSLAEPCAVPERIEEIRRHLNLLARPRRLNQRETELLIELLEHWAMRERWEPIIEWSSRAVLEGCTFRYAAKVYRYWLDALLRSSELDGAFSLCRHLLAFRKESDDFLALALYGLCHLDRGTLARPIARRLLGRKKRSVLAVESLATHACLFGAGPRQARALAILKSIAQQSCEFSALWNWYDCALTLGFADNASDAVNEMLQRFPDALEPLRVAVNIAIDEGEWADVLRYARQIARLAPESGEDGVALATALEYNGELFAAREALAEAASRISIDDYDFSATLGSVTYKLFKKYRDREHLIESIKSLKNALRVCKSYGIPSANFRAMLYELSSSGLGVAPESKSKQSKSSDGNRRNQGTSGYWLCMANDEGWRRLLRRKSFLIKVPENATVGDIVFLSRGNGLKGASTCKIEGLLEILTPALPDEQLGRVVKCGNFKMFPAAVELAFSEPLVLCHDGHGLLNFSSRVGLYYAEFSAQSADQVVSRLELLGGDGIIGRSTKYA